LCLLQLGDSPARAIEYGRPLVTDHERILGGSHADTLAARTLLAGAYEQAGRLGEAIPLFERTVTDSERVLGGSHADTLAARMFLAGAYEQAGRLGEGERKVTELKQLRGPDHPDTLRSRNDLAGACADAGRLAEAIPLHEATLADCKRVLGPDHPDTLASRSDLAGAYAGAGRLAEAIPLYEPPSPIASGSWAPTTLTLWSRESTSRAPTRTPDGSARPSRSTRPPSAGLSAYTDPSTDIQRLRGKISQ